MTDQSLNVGAMPTPFARWYAYPAAALIGWGLIVALLTGLGSDGGPRVEAFGPDDFMRLVQVSDLLDGAGWYDHRQDRLSPPAGVEMHWTRLPDIPVALIARLAEPSMGRQDALILAANVVPCVLLLGLYFAVGWAAAPVLKGGSRLAVVPILSLTVPILIQFLPGRVDHHGYQVIIAAILFGAALRITGQADDLRAAVRAAVIAGAAAAVGLWISPEIVPWLIVLTGVLAVFWILYGTSLTPAIWFAAVLTGGCMLLLPLAHPIDDWPEATCDSFSPATIGFAGMIAVFWAIVAVLGRPIRRRTGRLAAAAGAGGIALALYAVTFPQCIAGPYGELNPAMVEVWLSHVVEARSLHTVAVKDPGLLVSLFAMPAIGLAYAIFAAHRAGGIEGRTWLAVALFVGAAMAALEYQIKLSSHASLFAILPLAAASAALWNRANRSPFALVRVCLRATPAVVMTLLIVLSSGPRNDAGDDTGGGVAAADPAVQPTPGSARVSVPCDLEVAAPALALLASDDDDPLVIAAPIDRGPEILFRTPHAVVAAPYHRGPGGIVAIDALLRAEDEAAARNLIDDHGIEVVLICPDGPQRARYRGEERPSFIDLLISGPVPPWLEPIAMPEGSASAAFAVR